MNVDPFSIIEIHEDALEMAELEFGGTSASSKRGNEESPEGMN